MIKKLVYSKHSPNERCGVAYFAQVLATNLHAKLVHNFHGYSKCDELIINMDIFELEESEVSSLLTFITTGHVKKTILIMHDYRFSYLEDELVKKCDIVLNLSGEPALKQVANEKMIELFTPSFMQLPLLGFQKKLNRPVSLAFGFFSPRKKSFKMYISFYEYMIAKYPDWYHILVASSHTGDDETDTLYISRFLESNSILVLNFLPNALLSELISVSNLGVCFYPTGIMQNNAAPMAFFSQGKSVITTYGELTQPEFKKFTFDGTRLDIIDFSNLKKISALGARAKKYYWRQFSWDVFIKRMHVHLASVVSS